MSNWNAGGHAFGNGPMTASSVDNSWNTDAGASSWNEDTVYNGGFGNVPSADKNGDNPAESSGRASLPGGCFNCGEEGHTKAECPNPRVFTGTCRTCGQEGHRAAECPSKPKFCKQCFAENDHDTIDCKNKKVIDNSNVPDMSEKEAWKMLQEASDDLDVDDFKDAIKILSKANPAVTYAQLERELRKRCSNMYLIGLKKEVSPAYTNVNLQGETGKTHTLGVFARSAACPRPILMDAWPKDTTENLERLGDSGVPMERGVPICNNCGELGHTRKACQQEKDVVEAVKVICALCSQEGHRVRDCTEERPQKKAKAPRTCRYCESEEHIAKDCPNAPKLECRNCFQTGHKAAECTNERVMKCRNCDEIGHAARECSAPKDWSRVTCRHCGEKGHGSEKLCDLNKKAEFQAAKAVEEGNNVDEGFEAGAGGDGGWQEDTQNLGSGEQAGWEVNVTPAPTVAVGGAW